MIELVKVKDRDEGNLRAHEILKEIVDSQTLLALSGGSSPNYQAMIVKPADILPGAICMVDERFTVSKRRSETNESKFRNEGLTSFVQREGIELRTILSGKSLLATQEDYNKAIEKLFARFPKKVGVMGIGTNLHTAGIFPHSQALDAEGFAVGETVDDKQSLRSSSLDRLGTAGLKFPKRITLTLRALGEFQNFVILVFGEEKREALKILLDENENDMQKYPAIFYRKCKVKCWLVTDIA